MVKRKIVEIDEDKCNGCGLCVPNCHEGAIQIIDGKARLVNEVYCDGLGNCLGHCPQDAITIVERDVKDFDFKKTNQHLKKIGKTQLTEDPLKSMKSKDAHKTASNTLPCGCPGSAMRDIQPKQNSKDSNSSPELESELRQWPVQLNLLPPNARFFENADVLIAADCVAFACPNFHPKLLKGKSLAIGCPKLDDISAYKEKIKSMIELCDPNTITVAIMEVPCCGGLYSAVEEALEESGKRITLKRLVVGIDGSLRK